VAENKQTTWSSRKGRLDFCVCESHRDWWQPGKPEASSPR